MRAAAGPGSWGGRRGVGGAAAPSGAPVVCGQELRIVSPQRLLSFSSRPAPSITPRHHQEMIPNQL